MGDLHSEANEGDTSSSRPGRLVSRTFAHSKLEVLRTAFLHMLSDCERMQCDCLIA